MSSSNFRANFPETSLYPCNTTLQTFSGQILRVEGKAVVTVALDKQEKKLELIVADGVGPPLPHWHSKLSWKRPHTSSLWDWHQDFAFWRENGIERPAMCTIAIALGPVTEANGCMRLVPGSHRLGALPISEIGEGQGTDPAAVEAALDGASTELCELASGDMVVFHSNTLHSSGPNESDVPRTMLMMSYNARSNAPTAPLHPGYAASDLDVLPAEALASGWTDVFGATAFVDPAAEGLDQGYDTT